MKRLRRTDITGQKFGKLTVIERNGYTADKDGKRISMWLCKCECGNTATISQHLLVTGGKQSCGCIRKYYKGNKLEQHGKSHTRLYRTYCSIFFRCENPNDPHYKDYGARGIKICDEWKNSFQAFYEWAMNNGYSDELTIDRIDVNGNYEPNNCRWATHEQQQNNKRNNVHYQVNGETLSIKQIVEKYKIPEPTLRGRMKNYNISMQEAIDYKPQFKTITYHGETKTILEWSNISGLSHNLLRTRLKRGFTEEELFSKPISGYHGQRRNRKEK